jgi:hypothetical protein
MTLASLLTLADSSAQSEKVLIWTLILTSAGSLLTGLFSLIKGQMDRVQARKDKEQAAAEAAELLLLEGSRRERRLAAMIDQNTEVSKQAFATANGHNEKIKVAVEAVAEVAKVMAETAPKQIQVPVDGGK